MSAGHRLTHFGLCVSDLDRAVEFYCEALGFDEIGRMHVDGTETAQLLDVPGVVLIWSTFNWTASGWNCWDTRPRALIGEATPRAMNALGFTDLSFRVDDPDVIDALVAPITHTAARIPRERTVSFDGGGRGLMGSPTPTATDGTNRTTIGPTDQTRHCSFYCLPGW